MRTKFLRGLLYEKAYENHEEPHHLDHVCCIMHRAPGDVAIRMF